MINKNQETKISISINHVKAIITFHMLNVQQNFNTARLQVTWQGENNEQ